MTTPPPIVYLLVGQDGFAIDLYLSGMAAKLGDPATASLNVTRLDGRSFNTDQLLATAGAAPFLARRRLVILENPTARISGDTAQDRFLQQLEVISPSTALALVEYKILTTPKQREHGNLHWLERWVADHPAFAMVKEFPLPGKSEMQMWIQEQSRRNGGQITPAAAALLEQLLGPNKRLADQEINKLLAYVNYQRPVEPEDVHKLVVDSAERSIFALVDAISVGNRHAALELLRRLLEEQEPSGIFGMVLRQFRMLLLGKEILDQGGGSQQLVDLFRIPYFAANKVLAQTRQFSFSDLEAAYHRLLEADERLKSGDMPADLSLEVLVFELTGEAPLTPIQK